MSETLLYVDDDESNLIVFEAVCGDEFAVVTTTSGDDALRILGERSHEVAVLLADQRMPEMTGVELLEKARSRYPNIERILITAYSDLSEAVNAVNRGNIRRYIRKPWEPEALKNTLRECLDMFRTRNQIRSLERRLVETERVYALGVIAAGIAHELRNPLQSASGSLSMIESELNVLKDALQPGVAVEAAHLRHLTNARDFHELGSSAVERIVEIADGIAVSTRRSDKTTSISLTEVVQLTVGSLGGALPPRASVTVQCEEVPLVRGTKTQLGQVVLNLIVNALQAADDTKAEHVVSVSVKPAGADVVLEVRDTGTGMSREVSQRIFDPFFTTKPDGGTGLGLAISKKIVREIGGAISVASTPGDGTVFTVRLQPAAKQQT